MEEFPPPLRHLPGLRLEAEGPDSLPTDYLERVYAGVLGKCIGVYLGRPIEGWTMDEILSRLGPIRYYVHDKLKLPLVVTDDDVSGTFTFVRALQEHSKLCAMKLEDEPKTIMVDQILGTIQSVQIGMTWQNNVIEGRTVFWWGGKGISTEHTAFLNLARGIKAPMSGSVKANGRTVAEQIGAQIFIDGWAMVAPGNPALAAKLAFQAARVSHDLEAVNAAVLWAAMESEAFLTNDVSHLLDTGLRYIPPKSKIAKLVKDVYAWVTTDVDWKKTRQRIEDRYGYDKFEGICHVIPNHAIMIMAFLYGGHNFHEAMHIVNTSGWDTDCNSGNLGCLIGIMHGLAAFEGGPDWRGPMADRLLISSADGGYSMNNATRVAYDITNLGRRLAGEPGLPPPKEGAQYHFSLPGSVQGFRNTLPSYAEIGHGTQPNGCPGLAIRWNDQIPEPFVVMTDTFHPAGLVLEQTYPLTATPLVYPGQRVQAWINAAMDVQEYVDVDLAIVAYNHQDDAITYTRRQPRRLYRGAGLALEWTLPLDFSTYPICAVGLMIFPQQAADGSRRITTGTLWLDRLGWIGEPLLEMRLPKATHLALVNWQRSWVQSVDQFHVRNGPSFSIAKDAHEGLVYTGTRDWRDYQVAVDGFKIHLAESAGVIFRVQGLKRWHGVIFMPAEDETKPSERTLEVVLAFDGVRSKLGGAKFAWTVDVAYDIKLAMKRDTIVVVVGETKIVAKDPMLDLVRGLPMRTGGGVGLMVKSGSVSANAICVAPCDIDAAVG